MKIKTISAGLLLLLAGSGVFRLGAVLVGTTAFRLYGNLLGVRWDDGWERPYPTLLGDQILDAPVISHTRNRIYGSVAAFEDDHAPHEVCADSATVAGDGLAQLFPPRVAQRLIGSAATQQMTTDHLTMAQQVD